MVAGGRSSCDFCRLVVGDARDDSGHARGVSPYLPVNLSPEIERKIERVMILAEQPLLKRPIAAATVLDALPRACERDAALCDDVRRYLDEPDAHGRHQSCELDGRRSARAPTRRCRIGTA